MSKPVAVVEISKPATLPNSTRKLVTGVNVAGILKSIIASPDDGAMIRPRSITLTHASARACIGAPVSAVAYISGLAYLTLAYAYGQGDVQTLSAGAPKHSIEALTKAASYFKKGAGNVTLPMLSDAIDATIAYMLTLAAPIKAKPAIEKLAINGESKRVPDEEKPTIDAAGRILVHSLAFGHEAHEDSILANDATRIQAQFKAQEMQQKAARDAEAAQEKDFDFAQAIVGVAKNRPDYAIEQLKAAAAALGYRLIRMPAVKTGTN